MDISFFPGWDQFIDMIITVFWWGAAGMIAAIPLIIIASIIWALFVHLVNN